VVHGIVRGEYKRSLRVVAFDLEEGWARDVTEDIARSVIKAARENGGKVSRVAAELLNARPARPLLGIKMGRPGWDGPPLKKIFL
jgi:hypothetical protein